MKKIDILNFITDFRKAPNNIKSYSEIVSHLGPTNEPTLKQMLGELKSMGVVKELEKDGQPSFQVAKK